MSPLSVYSLRIEPCTARDAHTGTSPTRIPRARYDILHRPLPPYAAVTDFVFPWIVPIRLLPARTCATTFCLRSRSRILDTPSKMFIGGLSWDTTDGILFLYTLFYVALIISVSPIAQTEGLKNYFSEFGKVLPLRR